MKERHHPAQGVLCSPGELTIVFLTICTKDRAPWLACHAAQDTLLKVWREAEAWQIGRYVLMPNHLHLFCAPGILDVPLENWVRYWKSRFRRVATNPGWRWQSNHWDTRLRRSENYDAKWAYVRQNPVRAGLATNENEWPWQGVLHELRW